MNNIHNSSDSTLSDTDIAILVVSFDGYQDIWKPFFHSFFKNWPDCPYPLYFGTNFVTYADPRVNPLLIGPDKDYSSNLLAMLDGIRQEWIILWVDDYLLSKPVNTPHLRKLINKARLQQAGYLRLILFPFNLISIKMEDCSPDEFWEIPPDAQYRVGITLGLWQKETLIRLLKPGESAWDIERIGTIRSYGFEEKFLSISRFYLHKPLFPIVHGLWQGVWLWEAVRFLKQEGLGECLGARTRQNYLNHIYTIVMRIMRYFFVKTALSLGLRH